MKIAFLASDKAREQLLADAMLGGARRHGHTTEVVTLTGEPMVGDYHVACMVGVKSRELWRAHQRAGVPVIYLDKGYCRHKRADGMAGWEYWRVAINAQHPTARLGVQRLPSDRFDSLGLTVKPWRRKGRAIVLAGSSAKYHEFYGLPDPTAYATRLVRGLRKITDAPIAYRPKPSWAEAVPIPRTRFSKLPRTLPDELAGAHCLVTHGSNSCFEAVLAGVPSIILGNGVALPISGHQLSDVLDPPMCDDQMRRQWLSNIAFWQWTAAEMAGGQAWDFLGNELHA